MAKINDGGPAFPFPSGPEPRVDMYHERAEGMTLRQWYAGLAMQKLLGEQLNRGFKEEADVFRFFPGMAAVAHYAADSMIAFEENENE